MPPNSTNTVERIVDIRVDDHENPFKELRRLLYMTHGRPEAPDREPRPSWPSEGKFAEAIAELKKALEINPRSEQLHYALAQRYAQAGDAANAMKWLAHGDRAPAGACGNRARPRTRSSRSCASSRNSRRLISQ